VIEIVKAPPFATVQDLGFAVGRAWGLPPGGAMDPLWLGLANRLAGAGPGAAAIEWAFGSGTIRAARDTRIAVVGLAELELDERPLVPPTLVFTAPAGSTIGITPGTHHRFCYVAVEGGIAVPRVLGSRSTYLPGGLGGHEGRRLRSGDQLPIGDDSAGPPQGVELVPLGRGVDPLGDLIIRVTRGPQWEWFDERARAAFLGGRFTIAAASDRLGYRLNGPPIRPLRPATLASEAACPGAVQIPDGGQPIVLMPDGPTVGGYPKIAVVVRADLRRLAQCTAERGIRFREVSLAEARACYSLAQ
jgi:5-oxoprolinase (ATP-hydrolysing) subunit C